MKFQYYLAGPFPTKTKLLLKYENFSQCIACTTQRQWLTFREGNLVVWINYNCDQMFFFLLTANKHLHVKIGSETRWEQINCISQRKWFHKIYAGNVEIQTSTQEKCVHNWKARQIKKIQEKESTLKILGRNEREKDSAYQLFYQRQRSWDIETQTPK